MDYFTSSLSLSTSLSNNMPPENRKRTTTTTSTTMIGITEEETYINNTEEEYDNKQPVIPVIQAKGCDGLYRDYLNVSYDLIKTQITIPDTKRKGPRGGVNVPFPEKLYEMLIQIELQDEGINHNNIVSWQPHGRCFIIRNPQAFKEEIMPRYFNQTQIGSFYRQLNLYNFLKITSGPDRGGMYHPLFLRGRPELISMIYRVNAPNHKKDTLFKTSNNNDKKLLLRSINDDSQRMYSSFYDLPSCPPLRQDTKRQMSSSLTAVSSEQEDTPLSCFNNISKYETEPCFCHNTNEIKTCNDNELRNDNDDDNEIEIIPNDILMEVLCTPFIMSTSSNRDVRDEMSYYYELSDIKWIQLMQLDCEGIDNGETQDDSFHNNYDNYCYGKTQRSNNLEEITQKQQQDIIYDEERTFLRTKQTTSKYYNILPQQPPLVS